MGEKPGLRPAHSVGAGLQAVARDVLAEARTAVEDPARSDADAVHDFRKAMKRWRALLRLLTPMIGPDAERLRLAARDLARELTGARNAQSAIDALKDATGKEPAISARSRATMQGRIDGIRQAAEVTTLNGGMRGKLTAAIEEAERAANYWPFEGIGFADVAGGLAETYRRARRAMPENWKTASAEELHTLRQRVVEHRYQMELVEPLWPKLGKLWVGEAQRLRDRLGAHQNLELLRALTGLHQPLAHWRSRLLPLIAERQSRHVSAAHRMAGRLFLDSPRAFRRRLIKLWELG